MAETRRGKTETEKTEVAGPQAVRPDTEKTMQPIDDHDSLRPIEFHGGPLDGHCGWISQQEVHLCAPRVGVAISETLFECLHQGESSIPERPTSMAIYQRSESLYELRYEFCQHQAIAKRDCDTTPLFLRK